MQFRSTHFSTTRSLVLTNISEAIAISLLLVLLFSAATFAGTTYYVSTSGNDGANGTSTSTPWKTLGRINSHAAFQPGDSILLKRGDVFEGQIQVTLNGTSLHPIVIGAYGAGNKPIIYGDLRGRSWIAISGHPGYYIAACEWNSCFAQKAVFQYTGGTWYMFPNAPSRRNAFPSEWGSYYAALGAGQTGISTDGDSVIIHTVGSVPLPLSYDSIRTYRYSNAVSSSSAYYIIRDLDFRNIVVGFEGMGDHGIIRNCNTQACINNGVNWYFGSTYGVVDSCRMDTTGDTPLYFVEAKYCAARYNTILNVVSTIHGIPTGGVDNAGIGDLDHISAQAFATPTYGWNTIEYNTLYNTNSGFLDLFYCYADTFRYNEGHGSTGGAFPDGSNCVFTYNNFTMYPTGGDGMNVGQLGCGTTTIAYNTLDSIKDYGIQVLSNGTGGIVNINNNIIKTITNGNYVNYGTSVSGLNSVGNTFLGNGRLMTNGSTIYTTLASFQNATGYEAESVWSHSVGTPAGTFDATPDTLPSCGGSVTLQWASENAISASISPNIGTVSLNGSKTVYVTSATQFVLTLSNGTTTVQYPVTVGNSPTGVQSSGSMLPTKTELNQNYPNPFNPSTVISYQLAAAGNVRLVVYDMLGRKIATLVDGMKGPGNYSETFDGSKLASGTYFARLETNGNYQIRKILLMK
jgi:hypothetical protein